MQDVIPPRPADPGLQCYDSIMEGLGIDPLHPLATYRNLSIQEFKYRVPLGFRVPLKGVLKAIPGVEVVATPSRCPGALGVAALTA
jgi:hypothetical protein